MAEALASVEVNRRLNWLLHVGKRLGQTDRVLLKLSFYDDFPFGELEKIEDPAELYNRLTSSQKFSATESFQLILRRLALLGRVGQSCIELLRDPNYQLPQPESSPELEQKLSRGSQLMEAIVAALAVLSQEKRVELIRQLGGRQLDLNKDHCTLMRVISQLVQQRIVTVERTEAFVEALWDVGAPRPAIDRLRLYHEKYGLDLECFDCWIQPLWEGPRPASVPVPAPIYIVQQEPPSAPVRVQRSRSLSHLSSVEPLDPSEITPLIPRPVEVPTEAPPATHRWWLRVGCATAVVFTFAIIVAVLGAFTPHLGHGVFVPEKTADGDVQRTLLLADVQTFLADSVTITQKSQATYETTYYIASTSQLDHATEWRQEFIFARQSKNYDCNLPIKQLGDPTLPAGSIHGAHPINPFYLLPGDSMRYNICLSTTAEDFPMFAYLAAFDQVDPYSYFSVNPSEKLGNATATWHHIVPIGANTSKCVILDFIATQEHHGYRYFSGFINSAFNDTGQCVEFYCGLTKIYKTFNLSDPTFSKLCPDASSQEPCSRKLNFGFSSSYSILAHVAPHSVVDTGSVPYKLSFKFRWPSVVVVAALLIVLGTLFTITICLLYTLLRQYICKKTNT